MGSFKPLELYRGRPLILHVVERAVPLCRTVRVVTGYRRTELEVLLSPLDTVELVHNPDYADGMVSSLAAGMRHLESDWFFVAPADMPALPERAFLLLQDRAGTSEGGAGRFSDHLAAIFPVVKGRRGHPVLVSSAVVPDFLQRYTAFDSMRTYLSSYPVDEVGLTDSPENRGIFLDIDSPDDLQ
jgi:molybdenum cofactor cytidylyltransferase